MSDGRTSSAWARFLVVYWQVILGGVLISAGFAAIFLAWWGISGSAVVAVQLTYLVSGGIGGAAAVVLGGVLLIVFQLARQNALLARAARAAPAPFDEPTEALEPVTVVVPRGARTYHRADCVYADGKPARAYQPDAAELRRLRPCPVCEPPAAAV